MKIRSLIFASLFALSAYADVLAPNVRVALAHGTEASRLSTRTLNGGEDASAPQAPQFFVSATPEAIKTLEQMEGVSVHGVYNDFVTASIDLDNLDVVAALPGVTYIRMASEVNLLNDYARRVGGVDLVHHNADNSLPQPYTGEGIVVGIIDTGVEYGHPAFYSADGSELRIKAVWDQVGYKGAAPAAFGYGAEYTTPEDILAAITDSQSQYHGSHTMGIAAGSRCNKYYGVAPDADIVFVSFGDLDANVADGIKYIFDYADRVDKPCVINISLGSHEGPHDGTSALDRAIDSLTGPGRIVVGACGNEGEARMHAQKTLTEGDLTLRTMLTLNPNMNHKQHKLDIWGEEGGELKVNFTVLNSLKGNVMKRSNVMDANNPGSTVIFTSYIDSDGADFTGYIHGEINPDNNKPHVWIDSHVDNLSASRLIGVEVVGSEGETVHLWNVGQHEFSANNKSGFTDGTHDCTVGEIGGTARRIISVGSYDARDTVPFINRYYALMHDFPAYKAFNHSVFSSYGPTADGRMVPNILAPGNPVISAINRYAFPSDMLATETTASITDDSGRKYYYAYNIGTSMSAPYVTGTIALMLQANPELTPEAARDILMSTASTHSEMGQLPNNTYGAGNINAYEAVKKAVGYEEDGICNIDSATDNVRVYNLRGICIYKGNTLPDNLPKGIYLIKTHNQTTKIAI